MLAVSLVALVLLMFAYLMKYTQVKDIEIDLRHWLRDVEKGAKSDVPSVRVHYLSVKSKLVGLLAKHFHNEG